MDRSALGSCRSLLNGLGSGAHSGKRGRCVFCSICTTKTRATESHGSLLLSPVAVLFVQPLSDTAFLRKSHLQILHEEDEEQDYVPL